MTKKTRLINKLNTLSAEEKKEIIAFFTVNPVFESRIDWNKKNLTFEDFKTVFALSRMSRRNRKNSIKMFNNYNCKILAQTEEFVILVPLDYFCAQFLTSFDCGGEDAKWCIGNKRRIDFWYNYIKRDSIFYFMYFFERHPIFGKKLMIEIDNDNRSRFYTQKNVGHNFELLAKFLADKLNIVNQGKIVWRKK
jgi:hypothetical protein